METKVDMVSHSSATEMKFFFIICYEKPVSALSKTFPWFLSSLTYLFLASLKGMRFLMKTFLPFFQYCAKLLQSCSFTWNCTVTCSVLSIW